LIKQRILSNRKDLRADFAEKAHRPRTIALSDVIGDGVEIAFNKA
jgi:hypothetical protein